MSLQSHFWAPRSPTWITDGGSVCVLTVLCMHREGTAARFPGAKAAPTSPYGVIPPNRRPSTFQFPQLFPKYRNYGRSHTAGCPLIPFNLGWHPLPRFRTIPRPCGARGRWRVCGPQCRPSGCFLRCSSAWTLWQDCCLGGSVRLRSGHIGRMSQLAGSSGQDGTRFLQSE